MYSITQQSTPVIITGFSGRYYFKAGFYMFFGFLMAQAVIAIIVFVLFTALIAIGAISLGALGGAFHA